MPVIKRYANRKLYNTEAKAYVTLGRIADLIREGVDVRVIDHETGTDITAQIQAQIIVEQEKKLRGGVPRNVLTGLIQAGSDTLSHLRHALTSGSEWQNLVNAELERRILALIQRGDLPEAEGLYLRDLLADAAALEYDPDWPGEADLSRVLQAIGLPTRAELRRLARQLDSLAQEIDRLT